MYGENRERKSKDSNNFVTHSSLGVHSTPCTASQGGDRLGQEAKGERETTSKSLYCGFRMTEEAGRMKKFTIGQCEQFLGHRGCPWLFGTQPWEIGAAVW